MRSILHTWHSFVQVGSSGPILPYVLPFHITARVLWVSEESHCEYKSPWEDATQNLPVPTTGIQWVTLYFTWAGWEMWTYKMLLSEEGWWRLLASTDATYKWTFEASNHLWSLKSPSHLLEQRTIHHDLYSNPIMDNHELTSLSRVCHPMLPVFIAHGCFSNSAEFFPRGASFQRPNDHSIFPSLWKSYKVTGAVVIQGKGSRQSQI